MARTSKTPRTQLPALVALDLDGTLLNAAKQLTPRTVEALRALHDAGVVVCIATGRMFRHCIEPLVERIDRDTPVIAYNGAMIVRPGEGPWFEQPVPWELCAPIVEFAAESGRQLNLYHDDILYCREPSAWADLYVRRTGAEPVYRPDLYEWFAGKPSTKLLIIDEPAEIERLRPIWHERMGEQLYVTISDAEYLEFMHPSATKGWALQRLCDALEVDIADTVAFGDSNNDLPLLEAAGCAVAMANAREAVRARADLIAPHHDEDGVAQVIEGWLAEL